jgi:serine/threonine-protein kinase
MSLGRVDRYELLAMIGEGAFGGVYRARHVHTGQVHALKLARDAVDAEGTLRMLAEARAAASLHHPNVVGVIDGGVAATGEAFIVMELLEGLTLAQLLKKQGPLPPWRAIHIARQMLDGLAAAHANGIVHRDVKPSNVFLTTAPDGRDVVKVIDFGISKAGVAPGAQGNLTLPGVAMGTPGYMAPEQLGDARSVDPRADVYSVGATLFQMLTMRLPIEVASFNAWMQRLLTEPTPLLGSVAPHVPPALAAVVDRALARDPDARWPSAARMRDALDLGLLGPGEDRAPTVLDTRRAAPQTGFPPMGSAATAPPALAPTLPMHTPHPARAQHPPPQPPGAPRLGRSRGPWIVAGVVVTLALAGVVGTGAALRVAGRTAAAAPPPDPATTATAASPSATPPTPGDAPGATAPELPAAAAKTGGVVVSPPRIVGELRLDTVMTLAAHARPAIERCNPDRRSLAVRVDLMVGNRQISLVQPSLNTIPSDVRIARCVAQSLKDAHSAVTFAPGESGIYQAMQFSW